MNKTTEALKLAEEALNAMLTHMGMDEDEWTKPTFDQSRKALAAIREALAEQSMVMNLNDPHPPHRLCECTACLEYWTPLPDCDAFAGGGKPIDHIAASGKVIAEPVKQESAHYVDSTPHLHVGDSSFEDWYQSHPKASGGDKQLARDAYAAGMGDPLVAAVEPVKQEPVTCACGDVYPADSFGAGFIAATDRCQNCDVAAPVSAPKCECVDLTASDLNAIIEKHYDDEMDLKAMILDGIAVFKEKNK